MFVRLCSISRLTSGSCFLHSKRVQSQEQKMSKIKKWYTYYRSRHSTSRITFTIFLRISKTSVLEFFRN
jgi:hypothetical protein